MCKVLRTTLGAQEAFAFWQLTFSARIPCLGGTSLLELTTSPLDSSSCNVKGPCSVKEVRPTFPPLEPGWAGAPPSSQEGRSGTEGLPGISHKKVYSLAGLMVVGYQNLMSVSLKLVYKPPVLNLTGFE